MSALPELTRSAFAGRCVAHEKALRETLGTTKKRLEGGDVTPTET
jgi:hypothetical protein